ncbi:tRNA lysidine(34) synthetase TilS [Mycoplasmoides alvi]|uniref:tRNA lysidine(34) synthetase TilS n=1 Tax=Mycoplasmoides alvi TaxID=78580 RepID=UPI000696C92D|nr:tRNA lysidine(34) synthetase TilS [Mycoplasmoides alvi]
MFKNNKNEIINQCLASVSGGPDSMALLNKYKDCIKVVCHVNYNARHTSKRDENIVKAYCLKNNIKLHVLSVNSKLEATKNFQNWARIVRYNFMHKIAKQYNIKTILVAHNLNDFIETAIMQILKKKLTLFLGIKQYSKYHDLYIYRPFINIWKKDLLNYCLSNSVPFGIDESNFSLKYERNIIRNNINKWDINELLYFLVLVKKYNNKNEKLNDSVISFYKIWKSNKYTKILLNKNIDFIFHVLFEMFKEYNLKFDINKFKAILILMYKNNPNKGLRIGKNKKLYVKNKQLFIIS